MRFKFNKKINYSYEFKLSLYSYDKTVFYSFLDFIMSCNYNLIKVIGKNEYVKNFQSVIDAEIESGLILLFANNGSLHFTKNKHGNKVIYVVSFYFEYDSVLVNSFVDFVSHMEGIYYGYLSNYDDMRWQNEESIESYKVNNVSLKGKTLTKDNFGSLCIDVSKNYGRGIFLDGILYVAGHIMWFGEIKRLFLNVPFEDEFTDVKVLNNGLIQIQLFDNPTGKYETIRKVQKDFLVRLGLIEA